MKTKKKTATPERVGEVHIDDILCKNGFFPLILDTNVLNTKKIWGGNMACCIVCLQGEAHFRMDAMEHTLKSGETLVINSEFFLLNTAVSKDFKAYAIMATKFFLFSPTFPLSFDLHFFIMKRPTLKIPSNTLDNLRNVFEMLFEKWENANPEYNFGPRTFHNHIMADLAKAFCYEIIESYREMLPFGKFRSKSSNRETLVLRFLHLLNWNVIEERRINFYAKALSITPQYLATILKQVTGMSTNQWMHVMIIEKAKHLLLSENKNIQEVAKMLNYPDQSTFGKMFKSETGMSPIQFKKEITSL